MGALARASQNGSPEDNNVENANETPLTINMDTGRTLGFSVESVVQYADLVSCGEGMKMVVRISAGRDSRIEKPLMIFANQAWNYPIQGVRDNKEGVSYRAGLKGWIDTQQMLEWLQERKLISELPHYRRRILYLDNCSGHNLSINLILDVEAINTETRYYPANATHLMLPRDSFAIQNIKGVWSTIWEQHKMEMIQKIIWTRKSSRVPNPGKEFLLRFAASSVRHVNRLRDYTGRSNARDAVIIPGMELNTSGQWEVSQLTPQLQGIITKHPAHFNCDSVCDDMSTDIHVN